MQEFLKVLPAAATSPLAFVAYLAVLLAWVTITLQNRRINSLLRSIEKFPEKDRKDIIAREMNIILPKNISAEQWLTERRQRYVFIGFLILVVAILAIISIMVYTISSQPASAFGIVNSGF
jgi:hypothetical protein